MDKKKRECFYTGGVNINWYRYLGKTEWRFFKKLKIKLLYDPAISVFIFIQRKQNHYFDKVSVPLHVHCIIIEDMETTYVSTDG